MHSIYYISQGENTRAHVLNIKKVLTAGCKLIQLRLKEVEDDVYLATAIEVKQLCLQFGAQLIINDNVFVFINSGADGIHLGKSDACPLEIRNLASGKIIGGTANTYADCKDLITKKVDYIGLGPYHFTTTKSNLSPVLDKDDLQETIVNLKREFDFSSIYLIGGITEKDYLPITQLNIKGVALSGWLTNQPTDTLTQRIKKYQTV